MVDHERRGVDRARDARAPAAAAGISDLELLRRFEPIVRYTDGELFLPAPVDGYLAACDLLVGRSDRERTVLVPVGGLSVDDLAGHIAPPGENALPATRPGAVRRHRADPLAASSGPARASTRPVAWRGWASSRGSWTPGSPSRCCSGARCRAARPPRPRSSTRPRSRTTRASCITPGSCAGTAGSSLHYLFFYFMNDFRSTFGGANDHESDWEQVFVFLDDAARWPQAGLDRGRGPRLHRR